PTATAASSSIGFAAELPVRTGAEPLGGGTTAVPAAPIDAPVTAVRYPASTALCIAAICAIAALLVFARPQYHDPSPGRVIDLSGYPAPARGWTWQDGQPGYRFGQKEQDWNLAQLKPAELAPVRAAAA